MDEKYIEMTIENNQSVKSAHHRIDTVEKEIDDIKKDVGEIRELTLAVKEIAMETKATREDVNDMNGRLKAVEEKPLKEYEESKKQVRNTVLAFLVGIVCTFVVVKLGLKEYL